MKETKSDHPDIVGRYLEGIKSEEAVEASIPVEDSEDWSMSIYVPIKQEALLRVPAGGLKEGDDIKITIYAKVKSYTDGEYDKSINMRPDVIEVEKVGLSKED